MDKYFKIKEKQLGLFPYMVIEDYIEPMHDKRYVEVDKKEYVAFLNGILKRGYYETPGDQDMKLFKKVYGRFLQ